jgi:hypothetical protein
MKSFNCCTHDHFSVDVEIDCSTPKSTAGRSRSEKSFHFSSEERRSTDASHRKSTGLLETIYEDEISIDLV